VKIVVLGLTTSSTRNRYSATYSGLVRELDARGHEVLVLERGLASGASTSKSRKSKYGQLSPYRSIADLKRLYTRSVRDAHVVIVGPYVANGEEIGRWVTRTAKGVTAFCDVDTHVTLAKLERGDAEYLTRALIPKYDLYLSFNGGDTVGRMQAEFQSPMARELNGSPPYRAAQLERFVAEAMSGQLMA
jgi:spore maturation protein CgeB